ncbi:MAG TPA: molybdate ABC transporter permease subunit [Pyrinomonadaceae bacterium]|jgi:molybdate transport system permease protein
MILEALRISLIVVTLSTVIIGVVGVAIAVLLAKFSFRGKEVLDAILTLPLVLPPTVTGYYLLVLFGRRGLIGGYVYELTGRTIVFTLEGAILAAVVVSLPLMIKAARAGIESVDPEYERASLTLGKSRLETLWRITLPLAKRSIVAGLVLSFARALGEFGATLMVAGNIPGRTQTMPMAIYEAMVSGDDREAQALAIILTLVSLVAVYLTNRFTRSAVYG